MHDFHWRKAWIYKRTERAAYKLRTCWAVRWIDDAGRVKTRNYRGVTKSQVERIAREIEQQLNSWAAPPQARPWSDLLVEYATAGQTRAKTTRAKTDNVLRLFTRVVNPSWPHAVSPTLVDQFLNARLAGSIPHADPLKAAAGETVPAVTEATLHSDWIVLHALFAFAKERKYAAENPLDHVRRPSLPQRAKPAPSDDEWTSWLRVLERPELRLDDPQAWHLLILLAWATGVRRDVLVERCYLRRPSPARLRELGLARVEWSYVELGDAESGGIGLLHSFTSKSRKERLDGIPSVIDARIANRLSDLPDASERLFPWKSFSSPMWRRITSAAGVDFDFQSLRRASVQRAAVDQAIDAGRRQADHASSRTTRDHYLQYAQTVRTVAAQVRVPELPPLPPYPRARA